MADTLAACPAADVLENVALGHVASPDVASHIAACGACRLAIQRIRDDNRFLSQFAVSGSLPAISAVRAAHEIEIAGYDIVREIHRGGQGVVYQAVQLSTRRDVAIKVMKQGPFATLSDRSRFDREIDTLGKLNHPNIVNVHDAGVVAGFHYFVMNYVDGGTLDEAIKPAAGSTRAQLKADISTFIKVCEAVNAAHLRGVIHRDLKPSNVRVDRHGEPHVLDFGLAKSVEDQGDSAMTRTGQFVGSLPWASPEQLEGVSSRIDLRTDVYSLGAMLFQLLTGALPFDVGSNLRDALDSILHREPRRPSSVVSAAGGPRIDDELDTIVLKCLSKDRERRYQTAGELARDLRRYLSGDAIEAKRDSSMYVLRKMLRRYRLPVTLVGAFLFSLVGFAIVMAVLYRRSERLEQAASSSALSLSRLLSQSNIERGRMAGLLGNLPQAEVLLWSELLTTRGDGAKVQMSDPPGHPEALWALGELYRRHPCRLTVTFPDNLSHMSALDGDGSTIWIGDGAGLVQRIDASGAKLEEFHAGATVAALRWTRSLGLVVLVSRGLDRYAVVQRGSSTPLLEFSTVIWPDSSNLSFSGGRLFAAVVGESVQVWNLEDGRELQRFNPSGSPYSSVAIAPDDSRLAARDQTGAIQIWDLSSYQCIATIPGNLTRPDVWLAGGALCFSADAALLADVWREIPGRIVDLRHDPPLVREIADGPATYRSINFSPDGASLAVFDNSGLLRVFNTQTGLRQRDSAARPSRMRSVEYTADGGGIWTSGDAGIRLWDAAGEADVRTLRIDDDIFHGLDISPDGTWLVTSGGRGEIHRLATAEFKNPTTIFQQEGTLASLAISRDARQIVAASYANTAVLLTVGQPAAPPMRLPHPDRVSYACFSPDGTRIATACDDSVVRLWRTADATLEREYRYTKLRVPQIAFSADGLRLAAADRNGALLVWRLDATTSETWAPASNNPLRAVRFSPDGAWLVAAGGRRTIDIWEVASQRRIASLAGQSQEIYSLDISSHGELIASGDSGGSIRLWHLGMQRPLATLTGHSAAVMALRFSPDGRTLYSASLDGTLRRWELDFYRRHIAGNLDAQLQRQGQAESDPQRVAAWRRWAENQLRSPDPKWN